MVNRTELIEKVTSVLLAFDKEADIILFGSQARGDFSADSDWDFLMLTSFEPDSNFRLKVIDAIHDVQYDLNFEELISVIVYSKKQWEYWKNAKPLFINVQRDGKQVA